MTEDSEGDWKKLSPLDLVDLALKQTDAEKFERILNALETRKPSAASLWQLLKHALKLRGGDGGDMAGPGDPAIQPKIPHWPDTVIIPRGSDGDPLTGEIIFNKFSALFLCGYRVRKTHGLSQEERRDLLFNFMTRTLHPQVSEIFGDDYGDPVPLDECGLPMALPEYRNPVDVDEFGIPRHFKRLMKVANVIASNCCLRKRRDDADIYAVAIERWEDDLAFLYEFFYLPMKEGGPPLPWPSTDI